MFAWKKLGRIFDPTKFADRPWMNEFAQAPATLIFDDSVRVYFSCRPPADQNGQYVSYSAFVDLDRYDLTRIVRLADAPILPLGELGTFDEFGVYPVSVIRDKRRVLAYYGGWTRCESIPFTVAIGLAESHDGGITFSRLGPGPIVASSVDDPYVLSGPKVRQFEGRWYLWYVAGTEWIDNSARPEAVYKIRMATSDDGITWFRSGTNLLADKLEVNECQASPDVFFYRGKYHMFFCYKYCLDFRNNHRGYRIGYASSDDLQNWTREDEKVGIDISPSGWDDQSVAYPHVFEVDGSVYMLYLGNQVGRFGFGLARLEQYGDAKACVGSD